LVLPLVTYLAQAKHGRELNAVDRSVLFLTGPIERFVTWTVGGAIDRFQGVVSLGKVRDENLGLRQENLALKDELGRLREARAENERLRKMIGFAEAAPVPVLTAPIIGQGPVMNLLSLKIGKGQLDGVQKGMAIATSEGIVGKVLNAGPRTADVLLLGDSNFTVPVRVQRSRARAKVQGLGESSRPSLVQALRTDDIEDGDVLVTSGTDQVFPKGLVVGRVTKVDRPSNGMFLSAEVIPAVDIARVEEVFVLMGLPGRDDLPAAINDSPGITNTAPGIRPRP
jgi:rod shape-determining protein MreC